MRTLSAYLFPIGAALFTLTVASGANAKTLIYANVGKIPFDLYPNGTGSVVGCGGFFNPQPNRSCYQQIFNAWSQQGVTGIRIFFNLCGGSNNAIQNCSNPSASHGYNTSWVNEVAMFFSDMASANGGIGIRHVILTPSLYGDSQDSPIQGTAQQCNSQVVSVNEYPLSPFLVYSSNNFPLDQGVNSAYACSPSNPGFIGWQPFFNVMDQVLLQAANNGVSVDEIDIQQEVDFAFFTVMGRLLYDNVHGTDVLGQLRTLMANHSFDSAAVLSSVGLQTPDPGYTDCASLFGDPARFLQLSELMTTFVAGPIGLPLNLSWNYSLPCGGSVSGMYYFPWYWSPSEDRVDIHMYPYLNPANADSDQQIQSEATAAFGDMRNLLDNYGPSNPNNGFYYHGYNPSLYSAVATIGETFSPAYGSGGECNTGAPSAAASDTATGYAASGLASRAVGSVILAPFNNLYGGVCFGSPNPFPLVMVPPYQPEP